MGGIFESCSSSRNSPRASRRSGSPPQPGASRRARPGSRSRPRQSPDVSSGRARPRLAGMRGGQRWLPPGQRGPGRDAFFGGWFDDSFLREGVGGEAGALKAVGTEKTRSMSVGSEDNEIMKYAVDHPHNPGFIRAEGVFIYPPGSSLRGHRQAIGKRLLPRPPKRQDNQARSLTFEKSSLGGRSRQNLPRMWFRRRSLGQWPLPSQL